MKTTINEHGCTTHPYGEPSVEITVPMTVQGVNLGEQVSQQSVGLLQLSLQMESLHSRIKELEAKVVELQSVKSAPATTTPVVETPTVVEKPVSNGKKSQPKASQTVEA